MIGLYVSYKENLECCIDHKLKNGSMDDAIRISKEGYLIFESKKACKRDLKFPTKVLMVRIRAHQTYKFYWGDLLLVRDYSDFDHDINPSILEDEKHRPKDWIKMYQICKIEQEKVKSVFFISNFKSIKEPLNITKQHPRPPQTFCYIEFD